VEWTQVRCYLNVLKEYDSVTALSFDYGQKHRVELERAQSLVDYLNNKCSDKCNGIELNTN
jgi:7-cyano-7-deazaguanine synthase in queuosine biosynthesis